MSTIRPPDHSALMGGLPVSAEELYVGRPNVLDRDRLLTLINESLDRRWLTNDGPLVQQLEAEFAEFADVEYAVAVVNATIGLQLVAKALDIKGEVIMPSFTFIGTAHALAWIGLQPIFADVLPETHTLDPKDAAAKISSRTGAILGVHLWGGSCDVDELQRVADGAGIPIFFDSAHAVGSSRQGVPLGRFGQAEVFSLHATKAINALEAGIVTTNNRELARELRLLRNYAFAQEDQVLGLGINAKLNEFAAAAGITNLAKFETIRHHNRRIHEAYRHGLSLTDKAGLMAIGSGDDNSFHYAVLEMSSHGHVSRDQLQAALIAENVRARRYFTPGCHRSPPYSTGSTQPRLPVTERLSEALLQLPTGMQLDPATAQAIGKFIAFYLERGVES